jgi:sodium transport system permease protein
MNFKTVFIVYRKELLEMLRDKRTIFTTFILPLILYPLLFIGFGSIMSRQEQVLEERGAQIALVDSVQTEVSQSIIESIRDNKGFELIAYTKEAKTLLDEGELQAIVSISDSTNASGLSVYKVSVSFDSSKERNLLVYNKIKDSVNQSKNSNIASYLETKAIDPSIMELIQVSSIDTASSQKKIGSFLGMFLPYLMIMMLVAGASMVAGDLVAGEKERRTLETLLVSSAGRNELVIGKYLTVITVAMVNVVVNLFSMSFSMQYLLGSAAELGDFTSIPVWGFLILLAAMIPLATFFAALLMSLSTFSRNIKEAGSYQQPVMIISMLLGMISFLPSVEINTLLSLVPVVNIALLFRAVLTNEFQWLHIFLTVGSTLILDVIAIWMTIKLFNTESVLFRTDDDTSLKNVRKEKRNLFNSFNGTVIFAILLALLYYLGQYLQKGDLLNGLIQTQLLVILLPPLLILRIFKLKPKEVCRFKAPKLKEVALVPFIAISASVIVILIMQVINMLFPFPEHYLEQMSKMFEMTDNIWMQLAVIALLPGFCEEVLFRGFLIRFYEGYGKKAAVIISALLFAAFHLDPFRMLPTFLLGLLLGYLTLRSGSILNSMLSHFINNAFALLISTFATSTWFKYIIKDSDTIQWWLLIPAAIIFVVSITLFHEVTSTKGEEQWESSDT